MKINYLTFWKITLSAATREANKSCNHTFWRSISPFLPLIFASRHKRHILTWKIGYSFASSLGGFALVRFYRWNYAAVSLPPFSKSPASTQTIPEVLSELNSCQTSSFQVNTPPHHFHVCIPSSVTHGRKAISNCFGFLFKASLVRKRECFYIFAGKDFEAKKFSSCFPKCTYLDSFQHMRMKRKD